MFKLRGRVYGWTETIQFAGYRRHIKQGHRKTESNR